MNVCYTDCMEEIQILSASDITWQEYKRIRLEALALEPQAFGSVYADEQVKPDSFWQFRWETAKKEETSWLLVARDANELVGLVGAFQTPEDIHLHQALIASVYVRKSARGKKVGRMLMTKLIEKLGTTSLQVLRLDVNSDQTAAVKLYKSLGFITVNTIEVVLGDGKLHKEFLMEKVL